MACLPPDSFQPMLLSDAFVLTGGMGKVVLAGGAEITGALLLETLTSVALHAPRKMRDMATRSGLPQRRKDAKRCRVFRDFLCAFAPLRERSSMAQGACDGKLSCCC